MDEREAFMEEHGLTVDLLATDVRDGRGYYDVTIANRRGAVSFSDYSPGLGGDPYDHPMVIGDIVDFVYCLHDSEDAEPHWAHQCEVLEAITATGIEELHAIFVER